MKIKLLISVLSILFAFSIQAQVGIGTETPESSSMLDISSTSKGILVPRMTENQKNAISTPAQGLLVFQTNGTVGFYSYDGSSWLHLIDGSSKGLYFGPGTGNGNNNLAVGTSMGSGIGVRNTAIGSRALENYSGSGFDNNTAVGYYSLQKVTYGQQNTALGAETMFELTSGNWNTAIGAQTIFNSTGNGNTALGYRAGETLTTGSNNLLIGMQADVSLNNLSNAIAIGYDATVNASNKIQLGNSNITLVETSGTVSASAFVGDGSGLTNLPAPNIQSPIEAYSITLNSTHHGRIFYSQHSERPQFPDPDTLPAGFECTIVNYSYYEGSLISPTNTFVGVRSPNLYPTKNHVGAGDDYIVSINNNTGVGGKGSPVNKIGFMSGGTIRVIVIPISGSNFYYVSGDYYYPNN